MLGVSQARLARALGMSPAMLSQLVSGRRVKISDPAVLARMLVLDQRSAHLRRSRDPRTVEALLDEVAVIAVAVGGPAHPAQRPSSGGIPTQSTERPPTPCAG
ncbi:helix-turn-helix domain-containing protein [Pseudonocardia sp. ICBG601]|uniref:helix-turn-helix domain-containing protein n=1 Tax=Pseudonocardia sp. ICBG601 TaxID=2846759 RepID=UPI0027E36113|nr:helix-turn-helix domain-containing protein [Pseudonocardia sp. ICBG601]